MFSPSFSIDHGAVYIYQTLPGYWMISYPYVDLPLKSLNVHACRRLKQQHLNVNQLFSPVEHS